jgi:hypothetical protein
MDKLYLKNNKSEAEIDFNNENNELTIKGILCSENPIFYFNKIMDWLKEYKEYKPEIIKLNIQLYYLNTISTKFLINMIRYILTISQNIIIKWYYDEDDTDILELGNDIQDLINKKIFFITVYE